MVKQPIPKPTNRTMNDTPTPRTFATDGQRTTDAECWMNYCLEAEKELTAAREEIKDLNKAYGFELRDPNGTIWECAAKLQKELTAVTEQRDRLAEAMRKIKNAGATYNDPYDELDFIDGITYEALQSLNQPTEQ